MIQVTTNSIRAWLLASRPKTLTGAAVPVMVGLSLAYESTELKLIPSILCLLFALIMQIDANFINDYFDFKKGIDDSNRLGPKRACAEGWITLPAMKTAIILITLLACIIGLPLIYYGGWMMILVGLLCVVFCFLYTTLLSHKGLGDVLVLLFFGLVPVCITYYLQTGIVTFTTFLLSIACGLVIDALLIVNNYRDIDNDKIKNKITLVVIIGRKATEIIYLLVGVVAVLLSQVLWITSDSLAPLFSLLYLVFHVKTWLRMKTIAKGKQLNEVLGETARNILIFGLLISIGLLINI